MDHQRRSLQMGAAVIASEYLNEKYPDVKGFSPRSLRRMRDFYRTYENHPALLSRAMKLGWIQTVAIVEAVLAMELREWYIRAAQKFDWTKTELIARIEQEAHLELIIDAEQEKCEEIEICVVIITTAWVSTPCVLIRIIKQVILQRCRGKPYRQHLHDLCVLINI